MSKGKKRRSAHGSGRTVQGAEPISRQKRMKPLSRDLLIAAVVTLALAEVLLRIGLVDEMINGAMYILALVLALAALVVEYSGIGRSKFE